ncbi:hypothetical protein MAR_027353 [Mya arenaria]|uniref:Tox-ART-HYD1 domain-containing protein n=1 Tax=Mya arenaria TaxID=6604 RepID=A0ABY7ET76_MYAAR|nr:uncharacterized protein LOC128243639 [Mya arenaria]WAR13173.1 hypothetical protein MAR_027353 [Mya arenaria]
MEKVLYHYTDLQSATLIRNTGLIKQSVINATFGTGVYLTEIQPTASFNEILFNNYDDDVSRRQWKQLIEQRGMKCEVCIVLKISRRLFQEKVVQCETGRNVFLYRGDLILAQMNEVVFRVR